MRALLLSFMATSLVTTSALAAKFDVDKAHTNVSFTAPHLMVSKVKGRFDNVSGSFQFDEKTMKLNDIMVTVKTDSVNTNEADRDKHLRSPDFFDVAKFPEMTFKSTNVKYEKDKPDKVEGELTIRGITKKVTLDVDYNGAVTDPWGNRVVTFEAEGEVNRKDFGLNWNKAMDKGGFVVGDKIKIEIDGEAKVAAVPTAPKK
ncbi:YceI family protein [Bdellovibrio bacteriovorus]|uniref:Putative exported protein n=1 Tax=Bdellovibrio bacteriovorus (strain ATCC 15356 / DSM 50701 / NCIMB 9529 / HD100) TaxID=264462 RepID=Q6MIR2_BDEBA|nr:YceI family protein [Bdellovibrio bacteriovorus]CAE80851.1 putative exported protein [Bdellovibrio bacteriovorus HD100]